MAHPGQLRAVILVTGIFPRVARQVVEMSKLKATIQVVNKYLSSTKKAASRFLKAATQASNYPLHVAAVNNRAMPLH
jgi:hypothetical protein